MSSPHTPEPDRLSKESAALIFDTLQWYANVSTYQGERTGGVLQGCPRGPAPYPRELVEEARRTLSKVEAELRACALAAAPEPLTDERAPESREVDEEQMRRLHESGAVAWAVRRPAGEDRAAWEVHVAGPDDVHPYPTELEALQRANQINTIYLADRLAHPDDEVMCIATVRQAK